MARPGIPPHPVPLHPTPPRSQLRRQPRVPLCLQRPERCCCDRMAPPSPPTTPMSQASTKIGHDSSVGSDEVKGVRRRAVERVKQATTARDVFLFLVAFRILNALSVKTFFQPDEFFQSLEPAWKIAFGADSGAWITWVSRHFEQPLPFRLLINIRRNGRTSYGPRFIQPYSPLFTGSPPTSQSYCNSLRCGTRSSW